MSSPLSREVFEQHEKYVEQRFDGLDSRFDRLERSLRNDPRFEEVKTAIREMGAHDHPDKVSWGVFVATVLTLIASVVLPF